MTAAAAHLGPACGDLLRWLHEHAVTQPDGRRVVWHGTGAIARLTGKAPSTLTQQIGQLRLSGHVIQSRRGHIELAPIAHHDQHTRTGPRIEPAAHSAALTSTITALVDLAKEFPQYREGLAAAIAEVSRQSRYDRGTDASREVSRQDEEERSSSSLPTASSAAEPSSRHGRPFAIRALLEPLIELERQTNPRAEVTAAVANELSRLLTSSQLQTAVNKVLPLVEQGAIRTGIGLIVAAARNGDRELFQPQPASASPAPPAPPPDQASTADDATPVPDPATEAFTAQPQTVTDHYRRRALQEASSGFRTILLQHPAALTGAAVELWTRETHSPAH